MGGMGSVGSGQDSRYGDVACFRGGKRLKGGTTIGFQCSMDNLKIKAGQWWRHSRHGRKAALTPDVAGVLECTVVVGGYCVELGRLKGSVVKLTPLTKRLGSAKPSLECIEVSTEAIKRYLT